ncbi:MAG: hypothetical protein ACLFQX_01995 [Candidatus Kapaibacterium sp.]
MLDKIIDFISRNFLWIALGIGAILLLRPGMAELNTMLIVAATESLALALSGLAAYVYTRIDFRQNLFNSNLGYIFLGVHICVGLVVLGVYIAQIPY